MLEDMLRAGLFIAPKAPKDYKTLMSDSAAKRVEDGKMLTDKEGTKADFQASLKESGAAKESAFEELIATEEYISSFRADCHWLIKYFDIRKEARTNEIDATQKEKAVLSGADYVQDGKEIHHPSYSYGAGHNTDSDEFCAAHKQVFGDRNSFAEKGGMKAMGEAMDRGMVIVISLWDDIAVQMNWLDSHIDNCNLSEPGCKRGPCDPAGGKPETLRQQHLDSSYIVTDLKWDDIGTHHWWFSRPSSGPTPKPTIPISFSVSGSIRLSRWVH